MVNPAINKTLPDRVIPYLTRDQYRCAPTVADTSMLIRGGSPADQDRELDRLIRQASAWCDKCAEQPLTAQVSTETMRVAVDAQGRLRLHPRQHPIVQVNGVAYGVDPTMLSDLSDLSSVWVENQSVIVPMQAALSSFKGPLQFGNARPGTRLEVALTYVAGYAVTTLALAAAATDSTITVTDATGIIPGTQLRLEQGGAPLGGTGGSGSAQAPLVSALVTASSVAGNVVTLSGTVGEAFDAGAAATAMPDEVQQAATYVVTALLKQRGSGALVMRAGNAGTVRKGQSEEPGAEEFAIAEAILAYYRPVAP